MKKLFFTIVFYLIANSSWAQEIQYSISEPGIYYDFQRVSFDFIDGKAKQKLLPAEKKLIHPGCFKELVTELNGDNVVAAVNLSRADMRSCLDSNRYYTDAFIENGWVKTKPNPRDEDERERELTIGYKHLKNLGNGFHIIGYYEEINGSMGSRSSTILVKFVQKKIVNIEQNRLETIPVDTIERVGQLDKSINIDLLDTRSILKLIQ